jgi:hypothetical protein
MSVHPSAHFDAPSSDKPLTLSAMLALIIGSLLKT